MEWKFVEHLGWKMIDKVMTASIYTYKCSNCGHKIELNTFNEEPEYCENCKEKNKYER